MSILITPRATEKAYAQASTANTYVFNAPLDANKQQIAEAVATEFDVTVKSVTTVVQNGKAVRYSNGKHRMPGTTNRKDSKKAYVVLAEGSSIQLFAENDAQQEAK